VRCAFTAHRVGFPLTSTATRFRLRRHPALTHCYRGADDPPERGSQIIAQLKRTASSHSRYGNDQHRPVGWKMLTTLFLAMLPSLRGEPGYITLDLYCAIAAPAFQSVPPAARDTSSACTILFALMKNGAVFGGLLAKRTSPAHHGRSTVVDVPSGSSRLLFWPSCVCGGAPPFETNILLSNML
jgi:hypothetical protein